MDLRRLWHYSVLAETLNFRIASEKTYLTQPAFTRSIASLERDLGVRLFVRDKRHVELTPEGGALLRQTRELLRDAEALQRAARTLGGSHRELRIGFYGTACAELTYPILYAFQESHPETTLSVCDVAFDRGIEPMLSGDLDIGLLGAPCDLPSLTMVPLFTEPASIQLHESHALAGERSVDVRDLFGEVWTSLPSTTPTPWSRYVLCADQHEGQLPTIGGYGRTLTEIAAMVAYKQFVAFVPDSAARQPHAGVTRVAARGVDPIRVVIAYPSAIRNPLVDRFVATAIKITRSRISVVPGAEPLA